MLLILHLWISQTFGVDSYALLHIKSRNDTHQLKGNRADLSIQRGPLYTYFGPLPSWGERVLSAEPNFPVLHSVPFLPASVAIGSCWGALWPEFHLPPFNSRFLLKSIVYMSPTGWQDCKTLGQSLAEKVPRTWGDKQGLIILNAWGIKGQLNY